MIKVERLSKRFGEITAVDDLSFEVERGEVLGFLGPNGAGKTTTMRILTGFMPATSGTASLAGHDVFDSPLGVKRNVGYLPETVPLYPEMPVQTYLSFVAELKGVARGARADAVAHAMEQSQIADRRHRTIGHLSKGLKKRVGIAQALLHDPQILILDEPTEGLDPNQVVSIRELVKSLSGDRTVVVSTHILSEVEQTCSSVLIIDGGRLVASDTVDNMRASVRGEATGLKLQVRGEQAEVRRSLDGLACVKAIRSSDVSGEIVTVHVDLDTASGAEAVAAALIGGGFGLIEITRDRVSLEEVFLKLTRKDAGAVPEVSP